MSPKKYILGAMLLFSLAGCSATLTQDIYSHTQADDDAVTAFVALSNMALEDDLLLAIEKDYAKEQDPLRKLWFEYLLAKRTQQQNYMNAFVANAEIHLNFLATNNTQWVSIAHPMLELIQTYSYTDDKALLVLLKLGAISDGANANVISSTLVNLYQINGERVKRLASGAGVGEATLSILLEDE
ncbi:hypothetical protein [Teredinibacter sp. KSP-S5-2]|uniref:hypothetical protein n=1 Tax=Teredinibacter sp. KSP-S5-2 TaxID=3034506 RepID=UPI0029340ECF|nr:hypothetical protein [Teredinibacter sp. KSP-S5-2]WNO10475.1 hypothetical protein P5V12_04750 [Teredinibacter sp. KSP-S5-2]